MGTKDKLEQYLLYHLKRTARKTETLYNQAVEFIKEHKKQNTEYMEIYKREVSHEDYKNRTV